MAFDGIVTMAVAKELSEILTLGKVEKIYQPEADELVFNIHTKNGNKKLYMSSASSHARIHLTEQNFENPAQPMALCMLLRKHLHGGRIAGITQVGSERIIEIEFETQNELGFSVNKKLVIEIMGKHSNICLVDCASGKIIDCLKRVSIDVNRVRQLLPGKLYEYPPLQDKIPFKELRQEDLPRILGQTITSQPADSGQTVTSQPADSGQTVISQPADNGQTGISQPADSGASAGSIICSMNEDTLADRLLKSIGGISPAIARKAASEFLGNPATDIGQSKAGNPATDIGQDAYRRLLDIFKSEEVCPCVYLDEEGSPKEFHIMLLPELEAACQNPAQDKASYARKDFELVSQAIEFYFLNKATTNRVRQKSNDLEHALKGTLDKLYLKKQRLSEDLLKAQNSDDYRLYGELLTANLHLAKPGDKSVTVINYYDGKEITIPMDEKVSASKNAQNYFKKYGKAKTAIHEKTAQLEENEIDINYLESVMTFIQNAESIEETEAIREELVQGGYLRRRKNAYAPRKIKSKPLEYHTKSGYRVLVGKNNTENDQLTFKMAGNRDIWLHTKDVHGSHVILFAEGKSAEELGEETIYEAASIAAYHSKARNGENVPVDYVPVRLVKKPNGVKPGMVIFTGNRTVWVNPGLPAKE